MDECKGMLFYIKGMHVVCWKVEQKQEEKGSAAQRKIIVVFDKDNLCV